MITGHEMTPASAPASMARTTTSTRRNRSTSTSQRIAGNAATAERDELVLAHLELVEQFVRRYAFRGVAKDDLRQIGRLALVEAAERFDEDHGGSFEAFASVTIAGTLKRHFRDRTWAARPPRALAELHLRVRRTNEQLSQVLGRPPSIAELAKELEVDVDRIHEALEASSAHTAVSIDVPLGDGPDAEPLWTRLGGADPGFAAADHGIDLRRALADVSPEDRELLRLRFLDELSQRELAALSGLSQSYVSRVLRRVLADLRREMATDGG